MVIGKVLNSLAFQDHDKIIKISIHVGSGETSGYTPWETKRIAKAIILFGGLLNGIGLGPESDHHHSCVDPDERICTNGKHLQAIDDAFSIQVVAHLMSFLEASGYTYHGNPGPENQRYDFSFLESQGVIM